jgi:hypothetical protein
VNLAEATQIKLGGLDVSEVWLGPTKLWPLSGPQPDQSINGSNSERLGFSLALNNAGNLVVAGAPFNSQAFASGGAVKVFYKSGQNWVPVPVLYGSRASDFFGFSVAMNSNATLETLRVAAAAPFNGTTGECKIFQYNSQTLQWNQLGQTLTHTNLQTVRMNPAGNVVALSGNDGVARVYTLAGSSWSQRGLQLSIPSSQNERPLAISLNEAGDRIALASHTAISTGICHIYRWNGSSWGLEADLRPPDSVSNSNSFGFSVAMSHDGSTVAVGDPFAPLFGAASNVGRVIIFTRGTNNSWNYLHSPINGENSQETFGIAVALDYLGSILATTHRFGARVAQKSTFSQTEHRWIRVFQNTLPVNVEKSAVDLTSSSSHLAMSEFPSFDGRLKVFQVF